MAAGEGRLASGAEGDVLAELAAVRVAADDDAEVALLFEELLEAFAEDLGLPLALLVAVLLEGVGDLLGELEGVGDEGLGLELLLASASGHRGSMMGRRGGSVNL